MKLKFRAFLLLVSAVLAIAGCGSSDDASTPAASAGATGSGAATEATQKVAKPKPTGKTISTGSVDPYGKILQDAKGRTIYLFTKEESAASECYGQCADAWPPVLTKGDPVAGGGVKQARLGTTKRRGGGTQVTYNGHPLYYYVDEPPNQVLCQAVDEFGGIWYVIDKSGDAITSS